ncbi:signal recognition particle-docking protein FtsY [Methylobacterium sp. 4-46]|uniref:signal recognition particle-docking protein FtsY n=1 Tax=unclassified Methylobacterium TaxID=2615210 RepID=UPI000165C7FC|nr:MULTISPECIES: signal recognition particle-docking protein FtsY [Methylobacterium]ACA17800.1 signal recognition particle-docking protein FtsY [Methylobacterium sp. 4-46]WFT83468.1 signal recognition particle-docking protein FtsY [Methylobacterium nodulans]
MSDNTKPGWFGRLFGRRGEAREAPEAPPTVTPSEGEPDYAGAAQSPPAAPPTITEASPDTEPERDLAPELAGADLQPIDGAPEAPPAGTAGQEPATPEEPDGGVEPEASGPRGWETSALAHPGADLAGADLAGADLAEPDLAEPDLAEPDLAEPETAPPPEAPGERRGWWSRLTGGLRRTSSALSERVTGLFTKRKLDATTLEELEDALIQADFGVETATRIAEAVGKGRYEKGISPDEVRAILAAEVERALEPVARPLTLEGAAKPFVLLMVGVNGAGKTTTIGKLAQKFRAQGRSVMLAAGDTFRAAAIEQLKVWGERTGAPVLSRPQGADAAGLAFDALQAAREAGTDVLMIDTAGRLQNKAGLMAELEKIVRVIRKLDETAPHAVLLVLDATVGQNAISQVELFQKTAGVSGLVMTKLDGTARGGILVALAAKFGLPVHFIGVGEGVDDLEPFTARDFARAIAGLDKDG